VFENRVPRKIFSSKSEEVHVTGEECLVRSFVCVVTDFIWVFNYTRTREDKYIQSSGRET